MCKSETDLERLPPGRCTQFVSDATEREGWRRRLRARLNSSRARVWMGMGLGTGGVDVGPGEVGRAVECAAG